MEEYHPFIFCKQKKYTCLVDCRFFVFSMYMSSVVQLTHALSRLRGEQSQTKARMYAEFMKIATATQNIEDLSRCDDELAESIADYEGKIKVAVLEREVILRKKKNRKQISFLTTLNILHRGVYASSMCYVENVSRALLRYMSPNLVSIVLDYAPELKLRLFRPVHACTPCLVAEQTAIPSSGTLTASVCVVKAPSFDEDGKRSIFARYGVKNWKKQQTNKLFFKRFKSYKESEDPLSMSTAYALLRVVLTAPSSLREYDEST